MGEMQLPSDAQLLRDYAERHAENAFAELVQRYTDLVYSAALRQVYSPELARDVTQSVFTDLARKALTVSASLSPEASLIGWLYRGTRFAARDLYRNETRRTRRERQAMEQLQPTAETPPDWERLGPILDDAMSELDDLDRDAVLLRYFKNHDLRTVGATLGISDDAAQNRVSRAVERLREIFAKRGITIGASGLAVVLSANAVQAAPAGLALTISTAAVLTGTTLATPATITATKVIAMTALQKAIITATVAIVAGAGIYEARQAAQLRDQNQRLRQQQAPLTDQIQQLQSDLDTAHNRITGLNEDLARATKNSAEILRLRGEVTRLRSQAGVSQVKPAAEILDPSNPLWKPNWIVLHPFDLSQFPDSDVIITTSSARDVGTSSPASLVQTWIWAQRTSNPQGLLKTWDFPEGTTEQQKMERVAECQRDEQYARENPDKIGGAETSKLRDLFDLGGGYYLAFLEEKGLTTGTWISHQLFHRIGDEWRISFQRDTN
ncbi:MAG: sigma-70 family RNA polymerase sigma factor [Verrucomicrobiota bacterium]